MEYKKVISILIIFVLSVFNMFAIQIATPQTLQEEVNQDTLRTVIVWFFSALVMILGVALVIFIIIMIIMKVQKKIRDFNRKKKDFLYFNFEENLNFCHFNRDPELKRRSKRWFWLLWKRAPVYCNTANGLVQVGEYQGETQKKENFYFLAIHNKLSMFSTVDTIIMIPKEIEKTLVKKSYVNNKKVLLLECEGIDEVGSTDYYFQPLIKAPNSNEYLDFSEKIRKTFTNIVTYRNILKEELQAHRSNVIDSVESNPNIHFKRRAE